MIHRIRDATIRPVISAVGPSRFWTRTSFALELALLGTAVVAGVLTAGTLIQVKAGTARLSEPRNAALAWMLCAGLAGICTAMGPRIPAGTIGRYKRRLGLVLTAALVWFLLGVVRSTLDAGNGLVGQYFTNPNWNGSPAFSVSDTELSAARMRQRWNGAPPELFSVRWAGFLTVGRSGMYTFATASDDGSQLIVDNQLVVNNGGPHGLTTRSGSIHLDRGPHTVVLQYEQFGAISALDWFWSRDGGDSSAVPAWALSQRRTSYPTVLSARIVDFSLWSFAILTVLATMGYARAGLRGREEAIVHWLDTRRRDVTTSYRNAASLVFSIAIFIAVMFVPWPSRPQSFFRAIETTSSDLNRTAVRMLGRFEAFQADINNPQTGEYVMERKVQEILTMLRRHGVERYQVSNAIAENPTVLQEIVASAWPRKFEPDAKARFAFSAEPAIPGCSLIEKQPEVSLVYCP